MPLGAALAQLHLFTPEPARVADFYARNHGMALRVAGERRLCGGPGGVIGLSPGPANQLDYALYRFETAADRERFESRTRALPRAPHRAEWPADALGFVDPDGNHFVFAGPGGPAPHEGMADVPHAVLQHFALRSPDVERLAAFHAEGLGFTVSDRVRDDEGALKACFLRSNRLHHSLALFGAPQPCFDHHSFETGDWEDLKHWADRMGRLRTEIVWGIGRHGPGNDVFFMVRDPDGNLAEISAEIEQCAPDRPAGAWPHEERTLNQWGRAIMRS